MPRYFFDLNNAEGWLANPEGAELADEGAAHAEALDTARGLIGSEIVEGVPINLAHYIRVRDDAGNDVLTLYFRDAVQFCDEPPLNRHIL